MVAVKTLITACVTLALLAACSVKSRAIVQMTSDGRPQIQVMKPKLEQDINQLSNALMALGPGISRTEAIDVAHDAYAYPIYLAKKWKLTWPPLYHNTLRNSGARQWGLCTDWASAMVDHARKKHLRSMDVYWGVAFKGDPWREHSTLVVTAKGQPFDTGIILDPWRNSGELYWTRHVEDPIYVWKYHNGPYGPLPKRGQSVQRIL